MKSTQKESEEEIKQLNWRVNRNQEIWEGIEEAVELRHARDILKIQEQCDKSKNDHEELQKSQQKELELKLEE